MTPWLLLSATAEHGADPASLGFWFGWSPPGIGWALVNFIALVFLLRKLAWPKLKDSVRARHERIVREIEEAERARAEAAGRLVGTQARLQAIDREIDAIVGGVRAEAESEKQRLILAALEQVGRLERDADFTITQERKQLRLDLERELAARAAGAAEQLLRERIDANVDRQLAEELVKIVSEARP
ncbi:MAG: hypothetical protein AABZ30_06390 [Myxococcota bacterium]